MTQVTVVAAIPPLVSAVAVLLYAFLPDHFVRTREIAKLVFFAAFLVVMASFANETIRLHTN